MIRLSASLAALMLLAGCGLTPLYSGGGSGAVATALSSVEVVPIPSPGRVLRDDEVVPASYMNFYIGNAAVVVPQYGQPNDQAAVAAIGKLFPGRLAVAHAL